jgi:hypothetical protein
MMLLTAQRTIFMSCFVFAATTFVPAHAQKFKPPLVMNGAAYPTPFCTNRGRRVELGKIACLKRNELGFLARCIMVSNNPSWKKVIDGCPVNNEGRSQN